MGIYHFRYAVLAVAKPCEFVDTENEIRCDDLERISGPGCRSTYTHAYATGLTSDNHFSRAVATTYFPLRCRLQFRARARSRQ